MLDRIGPQAFSEWVAYYQLEPWGQEWEQATTTAAAVHNAGMIASGLVSSSDMPDGLFAWRTPESFDPRKKTKRRKGVTVEQDEAMAARLYG